MASRSLCLLLFASVLPALPQSADEFAQTVRPVLLKHCATCHSAGSSNPFLKAQTAGDIAASRGVWKKVAIQLRNRTMPPSGPQPSEEDRLRISTWIEDVLRSTACRGEDYAGAVTLRRLNRREYENTIRDLVGVELKFSETFPIDGSGGEGFDNDGETLFLQPLLMERYLEAAQQIVDAVIVTPTLNKSFAPKELSAAVLPVYVTGDYTVTVTIANAQSGPAAATFKIDGIAAHRFSFSASADQQETVVRLSRGVHTLSLQKGPTRLEVAGLKVEGNRTEPGPGQRAIHQRLLGLPPGQTPPEPKKAVRQLLTSFASGAFRRPAKTEEIDRFLKLYDRAAERGDPYEERVKLALKGVLVSPDFLFRIEQPPPAPGIHALNGYELAARLSYFLWESMPDAELSRLAREGRLQEPSVLTAQVDRMLADPKSDAFTEAFIGQWLGTKDVGGRVAPTVNEIQAFYSPEVAADMRAEPILVFRYMLRENRSLLDLLDADYTFLTKRLANFYGMRGIQGGNEFQLVRLTDGHRGGVLGLGGMLAMTSHFKETSPVLRGAWVLDTLLGTPVPPPPPGVPPLASGKDTHGLTMRQKLQMHRSDPSCSACHNLMDPVGFGLENFDYLGRWRDKDEAGRPIDASGVLPSGEAFNGAAELRRLLLKKKDLFLRHFSGKLLGYALGRSLMDEDQCTIQRLTAELEKSDYKVRELVKGIVLSVPFRYAQIVTDPVVPPPVAPRKIIDGFK